MTRSIADTRLIAAALLLSFIVPLPALCDWYDEGSSGDAPAVPEPTRVDGDESSDGSYDADAEYQEEARREEAARRDAERRETARRAAAERDAARREAGRVAEARREAERREAARKAADREAEAARKRAEEESRRTGFGPHIRTIHVPLPAIADADFQRGSEIRSNLRPVFSVSPRTFVVIGTIGKCVKEVPQKVGEVVLTYLAGRAGVQNSEEYLSILSINKGMADDAVSQLRTAMDLIAGNFPEPATGDFLSSSGNRGLKVLISNMSSYPSDGIVLSPVDEEELAREGRSYWNKVTGGRR